MNLRPLSDKVIVTVSPKEEMTASGLVLPDSSKERSEQGMVVAVGPGKIDEKGNKIPMSVKIGDKILFKGSWPQEVKLEGKEYLVMPETDILAVIE
jgi:chaperonin GroES